MDNEHVRYRLLRINKLVEDLSDLLLVIDDIILKTLMELQEEDNE